MDENVFLAYVIPVIFLLSGVGLLIGGFVSAATTRAFLGQAVETRGEVVALEEEPPTESGEAVMYRPVITYALPSGQKVRFKSKVCSNPAPYAIGDKIVVLYVRERPDQARIRSFRSLWLLSLILLGLGTVFAVLGAALLLGWIPV